MNIVVALKKGTIPEKFDSWAYTVARNASVSYFRTRRPSTTNDPEGLSALQGSIKTGTTGSVLDSPQEPNTDPFHALMLKEKQKCVEAALEQLESRGTKGKRDAAIVRDYFWNGKGMAELSRDYDKPVGTIKRILHVAKRRLSKCIQSDID